MHQLKLKNHILLHPARVCASVVHFIPAMSCIIVGVMMAQSISSVGRIPVVTSSMQSIGLQVTECQDASTQTLNEVGIQTDLSAVS